MADSEALAYRKLAFSDLWPYKSLLSSRFPHGFVGILFKEMCDNDSEQFFTIGAFDAERLVGFIIAIRDWSKVRQFTELENGLAAVSGRKLAYVPALVVDESYVRRGIGRNLLHQFLSQVPDATAFMVVPHMNKVAQLFVETMDFHARSTLRKYYNEFEDALLFVREPGSD